MQDVAFMVRDKQGDTLCRQRKCDLPVFRINLLGSDAVAVSIDGVDAVKINAG